MTCHCEKLTLPFLFLPLFSKIFKYSNPKSNLSLRLGPGLINMLANNSERKDSHVRNDFTNKLLKFARGTLTLINPLIDGFFSCLLNWLSSALLWIVGAMKGNKRRTIHMLPDGLFIGGAQAWFSPSYGGVYGTVQSTVQVFTIDFYLHPLFVKIDEYFFIRP